MIVPPFLLPSGVHFGEISTMGLDKLPPALVREMSSVTVYVPAPRLEDNDVDLCGIPYCDYIGKRTISCDSNGVCFDNSTQETCRIFLCHSN